MPSTTSALSHSSNRPDHVPPLSWLRTWIVAAIVLGSSVGSLEAFLGALRDTAPVRRILLSSGRTIGREPTEAMGRPSFSWALCVCKADISVRTLERLCPGYTVAQLAASGRGSPLAVLENLVRDERFSGIVLFDMVPPFISRMRERDQSDFVENHPGAREIAETVLCAMLHDSLVCSKASLSLRAPLCPPAGVQGLPKPGHISLTSDRNLFLDFSSFDNLDNHRRAEYQSELALYKQEFTPAVRKQFGADTLRVRDLVRRIRARGGEVVFVSLPISGPYLDLQNNQHPKSEYWDRFVGWVDAVCVDPSDLGGDLMCPDYSHLDGRSAPAFTSLLHAALLRRHVFTGGSRADLPAQKP